MEGISHEACSFAGTLGLGKLIIFYDDNGISIDGKVDSWFTDDTAARFKAYNWQVIGPIDGHNQQAIEQAIKQARQETAKPSMIIWIHFLNACLILLKVVANIFENPSSLSYINQTQSIKL